MTEYDAERTLRDAVGSTLYSGTNGHSTQHHCPLAGPMTEATVAGVPLPSKANGACGKSCIAAFRCTATSRCWRSSACWRSRCGSSRSRARRCCASALLGFAGFAVHYFLPLRWRLPFFVALSLAGIVLVLGCGEHGVADRHRPRADRHLPSAVPFRRPRRAAAARRRRCWRACALELIPAPWSRGDLADSRLDVHVPADRLSSTTCSTTRRRRRLRARSAYFFMLPNVCFPLFPVVDYKTFRRTYYDDDAHRIYQTGIDWMVRGVIHLLLYRFVYYHLTLGAVGGHRPGHAGSVPRRQLPAVPARLRAVPPHRRDAAPVRLPPAGDAPPLLPRLELHGLLAPDQHLLEGLHA